VKQVKTDDSPDDKTVSFEVELVEFLTSPPEIQKPREETDWKCLVILERIFSERGEDG
jgi:hypothetical protein